MDARMHKLLDQHRRWLDGEPDGEQLRLTGTALRGADLRGADLRRAELTES